MSRCYGTAIPVFPVERTRERERDVADESSVVGCGGHPRICEQHAAIVGERFGPGVVAAPMEHLNVGTVHPDCDTAEVAVGVLILRKVAQNILEPCRPIEPIEGPPGVLIDRRDAPALFRKRAQILIGPAVLPGRSLKNHGTARSNPLAKDPTRLSAEMMSLR